MHDADSTVHFVLVPDLLHATATRRIGGEATELAIVMAFAGGSSGGLFSELLARAPIAPSSFRPEALMHDDASRARLHAVYLALARFRAVLESSANAGSNESTRRQLTILERFRDVIQQLAAGFAGCQSGLSRLSEFAVAVARGEGFRSLLELLQYDEKLATIDFRVVSAPMDVFARCSYSGSRKPKPTPS
jgi:hypothetical protein